MQTITCGNEECGTEIEFDLSQLENVDSQPPGNHTTQHSGSGNVVCNDCTTEREFNCVWDEVNDTGEILSCEVS